MNNEIYIQKFLKHLKLKGFAPRTIEGYQTNLNKFLLYLATQNLKIIALTKKEIQDYQSYLYYQEYRGKPLSFATQGHRLTAVRMLCKYLISENLILADPAAAIELPKTPVKLPKTILTTREVKKILETIDTNTKMGIRDRSLIEILYTSGIRVSELINITLANLNLNQGYLTVSKGKGGKSRTIPLGKSSCYWIKEYIQKARPKKVTSPILFYTMLTPPRPLTRGVVAEICSSRAKQAGIKKHVTSHTFRHSCATLMLKGGADIRYVQELLGHAFLRTTQVYTKVTIEDLKKMHTRCHPRDKSR